MPDQPGGCGGFDQVQKIVSLKNYFLEILTRFRSNYTYYDMKKDNIKRKYRKYQSGILYSFGLLPYFFLIVIILVGQIVFNYAILQFSNTEMDAFAQAAARQYQSQVGTYYSNILKFRFDKYITDFMGLGDAIFTPT